jgi:hypothetical protein
VSLSSLPLAFPWLETVGVLTVDLDIALIRDCAGVTLGVTRPRTDGVTRPLDADGVTRPLCIDDEVEEAYMPEKEGVVRPPRDDATEEGRWIPPARTIGVDNFVVATKTPR